MGYSDLLSEDGINSQYLAILKPRRMIDSTSWTLVTGTRYYTDFDYGQIITLESDGVEKTESTGITIPSGDWYYDIDSERLYVDIGVNPNTVTIIVNYELYVGTFDAHHYRIPDDDTSRVVYYEPIILNSPDIISSSTDALFGFLPTFSTSITLSNLTHIFEKHIYDSSFNKCDIDLWHYLDELTTDNISLVLKGICKNIAYNDEAITISIYDRNDIFNDNFRGSGNNFYNSTTWPNLDQQYEKRPVRFLYGRVDGFVPVNISYSTTISTTTNRNWLCIQGPSNRGDISQYISSSPSSTTTRTYVDSANGFTVGDTIHINPNIGPFDYATITNVNKTGSHYVDHTTITNTGNGGDKVERSFIGNITIVQNNVVYNLLNGRDYSSLTSNGVFGFILGNNFEANVGMPSAFDPGLDKIYCRVYGNKTIPTLGGSPATTVSITYGNLTNGITILYDMLKTHIGISESDIDITTFSSLISSITDEFGFCVPLNSTENFPSYKEIIEIICQSLLLKIFLDDNNKWTIEQTGPAGSVDKTIEDDEILNGSFAYRFDYNSIISDIFVNHNHREYTTNHNQTGDYYEKVSSSSTNAEYLHKVIKQKTFNSYHLNTSEAQTLADRLKYYLGERIGSVQFKTKNRFFDTNLSKVIQITRDRLPGFNYVSGANQSRSFTTQGIDKKLTEITIDLDDQKGIEDNSGSW